MSFDDSADFSGADFHVLICSGIFCKSGRVGFVLVVSLL